MRKLRVVIVDDAVVVRRIVSDVLTGDPQIEVVGTAANGRIGLQKIELLNPDAVTLDVEMPEMNGIETVREIRKRWPRLPVIMFSTLTERGASTTLEALALGANDYVTKPANVGSVQVAMERIREDLIPKLKALCPLVIGKPVAAPVTRIAPLVAPPRAAGARQRIDAVVIGVSTGGPNALAVVLPQLPRTLAVPVLIVQHMPPVFTRLLAERLAAKSQLRVAEATAGQPVEAGLALIAPGDFHLTVERSRGGVVAALNQESPENSCRPAVDVLFRSAARVFGPHVLAVVLTGMGQDGLRGCEAVREAGGQAIAQDEASSVVWGMPGFVARAGLADRVLPVDQVGAEIARRVGDQRLAAASPARAGMGGGL